MHLLCSRHLLSPGSPQGISRVKRCGSFQFFSSLPFNLLCFDLRPLSYLKHYISAMLNLIQELSSVYLANWLNVCLTDWLTDWPTNQPTDWLTDWPIDQPTNWLASWLADQLAGLPADQLTDYLTDWLTHWLTDWLTGRLTGWLAGRPSEWLAGWLANNLDPGVLRFFFLAVGFLASQASNHWQNIPKILGWRLPG